MMKSYPNCFDTMLIVPFLIARQGYVRGATLSMALLTGVVYAMCSTLLIYVHRSLDNPNFYFSQTVVLTAGMSFLAFNLMTRQ